MAEPKQIYKCQICGNITEVLHGGPGELVCCGVPMELMVEKTQDQGAEKHVPVMEKGGLKIRVGSVAHPMEALHYIEWIEIGTDDGKVRKKFLMPGEKPEMELCSALKGKKITIRAYCNVHGLWKSK